jgi:hypothetical protein
VQRVIDNPYFFIASEMRTGKSAIVTWAVQFLFEMNLIDRVIIVAPAPVRDVWADQRLGELAKHLWLDFPATVTEFHARLKTWTNGPRTTRRNRRRHAFSSARRAAASFCSTARRYFTARWTSSARATS